MKSFKKFVNEIVSKWRNIDKEGLGYVSNREIGDSAENYIIKKVEKLSPNYIAMKSIGSQTPSDIFCVARRNGYWHIMLIQVKCSRKKKNIYKLNNSEINLFSDFAKFVKKHLRESEYMKQYKDKSIVISIGYAGVHRNEFSKSKHRNQLVETALFKSFKNRMNNIVEWENKIKLAHKL